ncbi:hypothetical protein Zmor_005292 [Zophobas morio]|uniref:Uncharacterized protein n=1 Tax=Zophobas morio TaxID=2755281 RepID=A0AA38MM60_9CUCU|nr:hypothetical protein Zmor_005292 [Zophobas morio]
MGKGQIPKQDDEQEIVKLKKTAGMINYCGKVKSEPKLDRKPKKEKVENETDDHDNGKNDTGIPKGKYKKNKKKEKAVPEKRETPLIKGKDLTKKMRTLNENINKNRNLKKDQRLLN